MRRDAAHTPFFITASTTAGLPRCAPASLPTRGGSKTGEFRQNKAYTSRSSRPTRSGPVQQDRGWSTPPAPPVERESPAPRHQIFVRSISPSSFSKSARSLVAVSIMIDIARASGLLRAGAQRYSIRRQGRRGRVSWCRFAVLQLQLRQQAGRSGRAECGYGHGLFPPSFLSAQSANLFIGNPDFFHPCCPEP